ncbi:SET domain protein [Talaromyces proteolyticus]|uniref:SET domain protein n=1 Tax=Talaromyces proteolyticus TaxID=1131652 RepID=A0AAD4Q0I9_9EURO|nr:SET domain protein [Talaromyces proteolyticus]KAH8697652.1 SET domain protein [Talaromyces proteolyticus]
MSQRTAEATLQAHTLLHEWVSQQGGRLDDRVQFARDDERGVHIQVKPDQTSSMPSKTCVIKIPVELTMSYFNAIDYEIPTKGGDGSDEKTSPFSSHGVVFPKQFITSIGSEETTAFFLMGQYLKGHNSFWYPYIHSLPRPDELTTPLFYSGEDLAWLNLTSLAAAREHRMQIWKARYEKGYRLLQELKFERGIDYSWELYLWASTIISSRAFTAKVLAGVIPMEELSEDKVSVLLPMIDATNHRPLAKVEWQAGKDSLGLAVMEDVSPGVEVGNNYGPRNNEQLMMNYGFCIPNNPFEYRNVNLRAPPGSPLAQVKTEHKQHFPGFGNRDKEQEDKYYVFSISYHHTGTPQPLELSVFSADLLNALSIIVANDRELECIELAESGFRIPWEQYANSRNLIAALNQIIIELLSYVQRLEVSGRQLGEPKTLQQGFVKKYRDSQIQLSRAAAFVANWTILSSRGRLERDDSNDRERLVDQLLSRMPNEVFDQNTAEQIKARILTRNSLLPDKSKSGEVFHFERLFHLLPTNIQKPCRDCLDAIISFARRAIVINDETGGDRDDTNNGPLVLLAYSLFICFIVAVHRQNSSQLSPRLQYWCNFLLRRYTTPRNDVAWTLPDENDETILSAFDSLMDEHVSHDTLSSVSTMVGVAPPSGNRGVDEWWLSPNWVRWAWLVLEQEMIMNIVDEPLEHMVEVERKMKMVNLLYIPRE